MVSLGFTWSHSDPLGLTWPDPLKPQHLPANWRAGGTNGTGGTAGRLGLENSQKLTRTRQESPEPIQEAPEMLQELTEPLFIPFHTLHPDEAKEGGHARGRGEHSPSFRGPALRTTSSRGHTQLRIARTNETKRFPGEGLTNADNTPQPPIYIRSLLFF